MYEEKRKKRDSDRKVFRRLKGRSMPLKKYAPKIYVNDWVVDKITKKYGRFRRYPLGEEDALNIGINYNIKFVIISLITTFNL